jgi:hypothetical protein
VPGRKTTAADAVKAYIQSLLKSKHPTWIELPRELWPKSWVGKYTRPVVLLIKALYGHPESGAHWEAHLESIVRDLGGKPVNNHPSSYFFKESGLLLTVYVDDLLLSGPADAHAAFWAALRPKVDLEEVTSLERFLGRGHDEVNVDGKRALAFNVQEYAQSSVDLYLSLPGSKPLRKASTPFLPEGALLASDDDSKGELAPVACKILMKLLWLARLSRPDLIKPIGDLARDVQKWSVNNDKALYRLVCYVQSTLEYRLTGTVNDPLDQLKLKLYVDADFAGDRINAKSTNGGFLCLSGPNTFFPLQWISRRQTSVSRSTTESEVVSLAHSLFLEALPMCDMFDCILGRDVELEVLEDNEATIKIVRKGYSSKLRHISRTHRVNLASVKEVFENPNIALNYVGTLEQVADIFTKALEPQKWGAALDMLHMAQFTPPMWVS